MKNILRSLFFYVFYKCFTTNAVYIGPSERSLVTLAPNTLQNTSTYTIEIGYKPHARTYQKDSLLLVVGFVERVKLFVESLLFLIFCDLPLLVLGFVNLKIKIKNNGYLAHFGASQWIKVAIATCSDVP